MTKEQQGDNGTDLPDSERTAAAEKGHAEETGARASSSVGGDGASVPWVDPARQVYWVAEHTGIDPSVVRAVLRAEYMVLTGIIAGPVDPADRSEFEFRYYQPGELDGVPASVDTARIAADAERLAHVGLTVAAEVLLGELAYFEMRGIA